MKKNIRNICLCFSVLPTIVNAAPIELYSDDPEYVFVIGEGLASSEAQKETISKLSNATKSILPDIYSPLQANTKEIINQSMADKKLYETLFKALNGAIFNDLNALGLAQQKAKARYMYGEQARTTRTCNSTETGQGLLEGKKVSRQLKKTVYQDNKKWGEWTDFNLPPSSSNLIKVVNKELKKTDINNKTINPESETLTKEEAKKHTLINHVVINPFPPLPVNESLKGTEENHLYEISKKIFNSGLLLPEAVKSQLLVDKTGTYKMNEWSKEVWAQMGGKGKPSGLVDGHLSFNALMSLLVDSRIRSVGWNLKADGQSTPTEDGGNSVWLERASVMNQAIMLALENKSLAYQKITAQLMADIRSNNFEPIKTTLDEIKRKAISEN